MSKIKLILVLTILINVIGFGLVIPVLPFYVQQFNQSPIVITLLFSVYSFFAFLSAPFLGILSDRIGRRPVLLISIFSTAVGWLVIASAPSLLWLFVGRIIDGLAAGNLSTAQSSLVDVAKDDKERTANLGLVGAVYGIGFILGPMIGGLLSSFGYAMPFWFAGFLSCLSLAMAIRWLPETNKHLDKTKAWQLNPLTPVKRVIENKILLPGYTAWFFFGLGAVTMQTVFALFLQQAFNYTSITVGFFVMGMGLVLAINQGLFLKSFWLRHFKEPDLEFWMLLAFAIGFIVMGSLRFTVFIIGLVFVIFAQAVLRVVMTSQMVAKANSNNSGEVIGTLTAISSLTAIVAPLVAGPAFALGLRLPFQMSAIYAGVAFLLIFINQRRLKPDKELPRDVLVNNNF